MYMFTPNQGVTPNPLHQMSPVAKSPLSFFQKRPNETVIYASFLDGRLHPHSDGIQARIYRCIISFASPTDSTLICRPIAAAMPSLAGIWKGKQPPGSIYNVDQITNISYVTNIGFDWLVTINTVAGTGRMEVRYPIDVRE